MEQGLYERIAVSNPKADKPGVVGIELHDNAKDWKFSLKINGVEVPDKAGVIGYSVIRDDPSELPVLSVQFELMSLEVGLDYAKVRSTIRRWTGEEYEIDE